MTKELEIEYTLANGKTVTAKFEATYSVVDNGIGHYEYWGARGFDRQLDTECDEVRIYEIVDENDNTVTVSPNEKKAIKDAAYDYAIENCPEVEECSDDEGDYDDPRDWD